MAAEKKKRPKKRVDARASVRRARGQVRDGAVFPAAPSKAGLPASYGEVLAQVKTKVEQARLGIVMAANSALILLYWEIGRVILDRQREEGWGSGVIDRLAADLRDAYPDMRGFSPRNLLFMRALAEAYPKASKVKQLVSLLPWGHIIRLIQRVKEPDIREWYMARCVEEGWSRSILETQINGNAHARRGKALTNFKATLPPTGSDMAEQVFKDPYLFDFLGTADPRREREVEQALVDHVERFLLELGSGFAFVGRQVSLEVGDQDFLIDLLFYHLKLRCYVVVELKAVPFDPAFVGQLNLYLSAADDLLRHPDDHPTIGLLLCRAKNKVVVEYALRHLKRPIGVAEWETRLVGELPKELKGNLPTVEEFEAELASPPQQPRKPRRRRS
jgi:predicted nuclease of restriction endonuclease-like (RecB) superfamily